MKTFVCMNHNVVGLTYGKSYKGFRKDHDGLDMITIHENDDGLPCVYHAWRFIPASENVRADSMFKRGLDTVGMSISRFLRDHDISDHPIPTGHEALKELGANEPSSIPNIPLITTGLKYEFPERVAETLKETLKPSIDRHIEQTRFMKFWREHDHMNVHEASKAYAEVMADREEKPKTFYRVAHNQVGFSTVKGNEVLYYGEDFSLAYNAVAEAMASGNYKEIYIGKFVNSPVDDAE